jgi:hypothetical protein
MKIKEIRKATDGEQVQVPAGCGSAAGDGLDKPPC